MALEFPQIDPVAFQVGPVAIRWYALAYLAGFVLGWRWCIHLAGRTGSALTPRHFDDLLTWSVLAVILGGRLGYVLFYDPARFMAEPAQILQIWTGGMSFHGGLAGVVVAIFLFARRHGLHPLALGDVIACAAPIGLFFGRIANFINGELWGRASDAPWAMVFPHAGPEARHPSQLYEAALEGLLLFIILNWLAIRGEALRRTGLLSGLFLAGYGLSRGFVEFFREPDAQIGHIFGLVTMGQLLCLPMIALGLWLVMRSLKTGAPADRG